MTYSSVSSVDAAHINISCQQGVVPDAMKIAQVIRIYKKLNQKRH